MAEVMPVSPYTWMTFGAAAEVSTVSTLDLVRQGRLEGALEHFHRTALAAERQTRQLALIDVANLQVDSAKLRQGASDEARRELRRIARSGRGTSDPSPTGSPLVEVLRSIGRREKIRFVVPRGAAPTLEGVLIASGVRARGVDLSCESNWWTGGQLLDAGVSARRRSSRGPAAERHRPLSDRRPLVGRPAASGRRGRRTAGRQGLGFLSAVSAASGHDPGRGLHGGAPPADGSGALRGGRPPGRTPRLLPGLRRRAVGGLGDSRRKPAASGVADRGHARRGRIRGPHDPAAELDAAAGRGARRHPPDGRGLGPHRRAAAERPAGPFRRGADLARPGVPRPEGARVERRHECARLGPVPLSHSVSPVLVQPRARRCLPGRRPCRGSGDRRARGLAVRTPAAPCPGAPEARRGRCSSSSPASASFDRPGPRPARSNSGREATFARRRRRFT